MTLKVLRSRENPEDALSQTYTTNLRTNKDLSKLFSDDYLIVYFLTKINNIGEVTFCIILKI